MTIVPRRACYLEKVFPLHAWALNTVITASQPPYTTTLQRGFTTAPMALSFFFLLFTFYCDQ